MTDSNRLPDLVPLGAGPVYEDMQIWLPQLFAETARGGNAVIENRTFIRCRFEGPAVILPISGCAFDGCNMGDAQGDTRNLLLAPIGPQKVTGVIPFRNCTFRDSAFFLVGFTGPPAFLQQFHAMVGGEPS